MSHKKRKSYVIYTLGRLTEYSMRTPGIVRTVTIGTTNFGWVPSYYTREGLVSKIAINYVYSNKKEAIIHNISKDMLEKTVDTYTVKLNDCLFGYRTHVNYINIYFLGKITADGLEAVRLEDIWCDIADKIDKIHKRIEKRTKRVNSIKASESFKFREGNVPGIGHSKWHRGTYYRVPKLKNVTTQNVCCEESTLIKSKYKPKNLPVWDDRFRHNDESWKTSCKIKKQWMKHLNNHIDMESNEVYFDESLDLM